MNPFGFTGYQKENVGGMLYAQARYYDPRNGWFNAEDTVRDGLNWYEYARSNPLRFVDPSGNITIAIPKPIPLPQAPSIPLPNPSAPFPGVFGPGDWRYWAGDSVAIPPSVVENSLPTTGEPNSKRHKYNKDGSVKQEREYGPDGRALRDTDYNHSDDGTHEFPHIHDWDWSKIPPRQPGRALIEALYLLLPSPNRVVGLQGAEGRCAD